MSKFEIAIIGGGVSGLSTAISIHKLLSDRVSITVYERSPVYTEVGAGIGIGPNAVRVLDRMDLREEMLYITAKQTSIFFRIKRSDTGAPLVDVRANDDPDRKDEIFDEYRVLRTDLIKVFCEVIEKRGAAVLKTNMKCIGVEKSGDKMKVLFDGEKEIFADLVVGADGTHSMVREAYYHDNAVPEGIVAYRGLVPNAEVPPECRNIGSIWVGPQRHFLSYPVGHNNNTQNIVGFAPMVDGEEAVESWRGTATRDEFASKFADFEPSVRETIAKLPEKVMKWKMYDREPFETWFFEGGQVVLLGDACHAVLPHQGQGAGQSIEDSYALALSVASFINSGDPLSKLSKYMQVYQDLRYPRTKKVQSTTRSAGKLMEQRLLIFGGKSPEHIYEQQGKMMTKRMWWIWDYDVGKDWNEKAAAAGLLQPTV